MDERLFELLLHRPPMLLLDRVIGTGEGWAEAEVHITPRSAFYADPDGVPAWIGIEYMAQTVGLMAGADALREGRGAPTGYLLGTRRLNSEVDCFAAGQVLHVSAHEAFVDGNGLGAYNCAVDLDGRRLSSCRLTVYRRSEENPQSA